MWHFPNYLDAPEMKLMAGDTPERDELREYARLIAEALKRGERRLP